MIMHAERHKFFGTARISLLTNHYTFEKYTKSLSKKHSKCAFCAFMMSVATFMILFSLAFTLFIFSVINYGSKDLLWLHVFTFFVSILSAMSTVMCLLNFSVCKKPTWVKLMLTKLQDFFVKLFTGSDIVLSPDEDELKDNTLLLDMKEIINASVSGLFFEIRRLRSKL